MAATRASGTTAVRYGTMREAVLGLTVVLADGRVIHTGGRARKSSAGYDLTRLFVGSEGTLGVITEITLRLFGLPEAISAAVCPFDTMEGAVQTVITTIQLGIPVARIELLDEAQIDAVNRYSKSELRAETDAVLRIPWDEPAGGLGERDRGAGDRRRKRRPRFPVGDDDGGAREVVARRGTTRSMPPSRFDRAASRGRPTCACRSHGLPSAFSKRARDVQRAGVLAPLVGHVGDGNFHLDLSDESGRPDGAGEGEGRSTRRLVRRALAMGGTCSGEHGVGVGKMEYLEAEHGESLEVMKAIKRALDPDNRMNPGKMFI